MSVFDNDTSKGYSDRNPTGPSQQDINPQNYRLAKISKAEAYFLGKMTKREKLANNFKSRSEKPAQNQEGNAK